MSPRTPLYDPDLQPLDRVVKVRLSRRQLRDVDRLAAEFSMSRAWFLREALAIGLPAAAAHIRMLRDQGLRPAGTAHTPQATGPRRGPRSDGARDDRWVTARGSRPPVSRSADVPYDEG